ncbi:pR45 [rat cytomegalovirus strain Maastricht]|uniref:PR45 n=1 Tax=Rat cytomegalovirus (strain Maastricht) TaxID=79700 RepID=Q9DWE5_RCMVM|nr:pR45 [rat cytomegalovirus strain Maastricht]AAF99144.1 pR45 [rat cytomegalovirus strain Maastricht]WEG71971.1 ribonucleotide reductase subunit 1 [Murid betaherpesvirus 2]
MSRKEPQHGPRRVQFAHGGGFADDDSDDDSSGESFCVFNYPGPDSPDRGFSLGSTVGSGLPSYVKLSGVSGIQIGNSNVMSVASCDVRDGKKRYPKSPPPPAAGAFGVAAAGGRSAFSVASAAAGVGQGVAAAGAAVERPHERQSRPASSSQQSRGQPAARAGGRPSDPRAGRAAVRPTRETSASAPPAADGESAGAAPKSGRRPSAPPVPVETSEDDFYARIDDVRIGGRPVVVDPEDVARASAGRPFRAGRDTSIDSLILGSTVSVRCYCHGVSGRRRYCPFAEDRCSESAWLESMERVRRAAVDVERCGPVPLYSAVVGESPRILDADPGLDRELGRFYVKTAFRKHEMTVSDMLRHSNRLRRGVQDFFSENAAAVDAAVARVVERVGESLDRGLYSVVAMMDRYANVLEGREELPVCVAARVAAAIAVDCDTFGGGCEAVFSARPRGALEVFEAVLSALCSFAVVLPPQVMAHAGLRGGLPLFEGVAYRPRGVAVEGTWNGSMQNVCDLLANGVSVSVQLSDLLGDVAGILKSFGLFCASLRDHRRFDTKLRVVVDLWSVDLVYAFSFILGEGRAYPELLYAVNVPQFFWERYVEEGASGRWQVFQKSECKSLCRVDEKGFRTAYERLELEGNGLSLSPWWVVRHLDACVALGNTAVVYPYNLKSAMVGETGRLLLCGPELSLVCNSFLGVFPENKIDVCLENCLLEGSGADDAAAATEGEVPVLGHEVFFSFRSLRVLVRDAVVIGNVLMDAVIRDNVFGAGDVMCLYRPLQLRVLGFHAVLGRLGLLYTDDASVLLGRRIAEFVHYAAVRASVDLCVHGAEPFPKFSRSLFATGRLYPDLFDDPLQETSSLPAGHWAQLREDVVRYGVRNSAFVCGGLGEESANVAGTTPGMFPRAYNLSLEPSPLLAAPRDRCLGEALRVAEDLRLDLPNASDRSLLALVGNQRVYLPVVNRYLAEIPRSRAVLAVRMGYAAGLYAGVEEEDEDRASLETGWMTSQEAVLKMAVDRQPYVDQGQGLPLFLGSGRSMVDVARHLRRAGAAGLGIGLYKCRVASSNPPR